MRPLSHLQCDEASPTRLIIARELANAKGARRGMPPIGNILDLLPRHLLEEVLADSDAVIAVLRASGVAL